MRVVQQSVNRLKRLGVEASPEDPRLQRLLDEVKAREARGFTYEAANASFELLAHGIAIHAARRGGGMDCFVASLLAMTVAGCFKLI